MQNIGVGFALFLLAQPVLGQEIELKKHISESVTTSLFENLIAESDLEWHASASTPEKLFEQVEEAGDPIAWKALCESLEPLQKNQLALFGDEIEKASAKLPCAAKLTEELNEFWDDFETRVNAHRKTEPTRERFETREIILGRHADPIFYGGGLKAGEIALTFDDGPHPTRTAKILAILSEYGARANYFEVGQEALKYPALSKAVVASGHILGSHSFSHPHLPSLKPAQARMNILKGVKAVEEASGEFVPFFRFPYGARNKELQHYVTWLHLKTFFWNMDSFDWKIRNPDALWKTMMKELKREKGGIILFHDIHEQTVRILPLFLDELKARGFKLVVFLPNPSTKRTIP